jgi:protoheme IX farnesyltransferase
MALHTTRLYSATGDLIIADSAREDETMQTWIPAAEDGQTSSPRHTARRLLACYLELAKARLGTLVVLTTVAGFLLAARGEASPWLLICTAVGTALSAFGANILNQLIEVDRDRRMVRTRNRPLPAGKVGRSLAAVWGVGSAAVGLGLLAMTTNWLTTGLSLFIVLLYLLVYTPLKVRTPLNTVVGAVCGAVPPMMGWTAATGRLDLGAWMLFGILFLWQMPHFLSLAWLYRVDYDRGGFRMLPSVDPNGTTTGWIALLYAGSLLPVTTALAWAGLSGTTFLVSSQLLGIGFAALGWGFLRDRSDRSARRLFLASIAYLPLLFVLMVVDMDDRVARLRGEPEAQVVELTAPAHDAPHLAVDF